MWAASLAGPFALLTFLARKHGDQISLRGGFFSDDVPAFECVGDAIDVKQHFRQIPFSAVL